MNREIKFRAWDGELMRYEFSVQSNGDGINYRGEVGKQWELMQFTGLTDKNGKEVYEGDIIEIDSYNYAIEFIDGCFVIQKGDDIITLSELTKNGWWITPVGNIYENPELLNL